MTASIAGARYLTIGTFPLRLRVAIETAAVFQLELFVVDARACVARVQRHSQAVGVISNTLLKAHRRYRGHGSVAVDGRCLG